MADTTLQIFSIIFVIIAMVLVLLTRHFQSRYKQLAMRPIDAFAPLPTWIGRTIESNRPLHLSIGSADVGSSSTLVALAGAELFYYIARDVARGDVSPIISTTSTTAIPLAQDTLRRAYQSRNRSAYYRAQNAHWYPAGQRSMAFAAALTDMMEIDNPTAHILAGSFGPELALVLDAANHQKQGTFAVSDQIEGQAIAFALADQYLIGEELFVASSYLSDDPNNISEMLAIDILRGFVVVGLIALGTVGILQHLGMNPLVRNVAFIGILGVFTIGVIINARR